MSVSNEKIDQAIDTIYQLINMPMNNIDRAKLTDAMKVLEINKKANPNFKVGFKLGISTLVAWPMFIGAEYAINHD